MSGDRMLFLLSRFVPVPMTTLYRTFDGTRQRTTWIQWAGRPWLPVTVPA